MAKNREKITVVILVVAQYTSITGLAAHRVLSACLLEGVRAEVIAYVSRMVALT